jgi:AcrR family transcriptional regulator
VSTTSRDTVRMAEPATEPMTEPVTVPTTPRRGRPGYDRQRVLDVVVGAFNEHGYDATSVSLLAHTLGLSKSALYHHFTSKEEILGTALDTALGALEAVLEQPGAREGAAVDRLEHVVRGAMRVLVEYQPYVTLLLRVRGNTEVEQAALDRRRTFDRQVTALITAARDEGSLRRDIDARIAERLVFGMLNSVVEWYRPGGPETADQLADDLLKVALDGLRAR